MSQQTATGQGVLADETALRFAMLSVYYRALRIQLENRGAPAIFLPPEVRPLGLAEALDTLRQWPSRLRDAVWRLVRVVPVPRHRVGKLLPRYPRELLDVISRDQLAYLDDRRRAYREGAHLFAAALVACADEQWEPLEELQGLMRDQVENGPTEVAEFSAATETMLGQPAQEFLTTLSKAENRATAASQLAKLEDEVGLSLYTFVEEFADAVAFVDFTDTFDLWSGGGGATVYPVSSVIRQDSSTLTTTATVTTLVRTDFQNLCRATDPQCWPRCSDVIRATRFVQDPFTCEPLPRDRIPPMGEGWSGVRLLEEWAALSWGPDPNQQGAFHNVLRANYSVREDRSTADLEFSLSRSIDSRILWDERAGGIQINEGYLKVRPVTDDRWRVTSRKVLRFSDRTPFSSGPGWLDLGQMLNYLAPGALNWWLESEMYSTGCPLDSDPEPVAGRLDVELRRGS